MRVGVQTLQSLEKPYDVLMDSRGSLENSPAESVIMNKDESRAGFAAKTFGIKLGLRFWGSERLGFQN